LSKIAITADQKAPLQFERSCLIRRSHGRKVINELVELTGIEPATYGLQSRRSPS
jgi:hypothetical protein